MEGTGLTGVFFITGAESTGKSTLTDQLALRFGGTGIPEYARTYLENLGRSYELKDVEHIAQTQIRLIRENRGRTPVFFDTCLINLKVWFREAYGLVPGWLEEAIPDLGRGIYLLCEPDLPWEYDPLRENPNRREYLNDQYKKELESAGFMYFRIFGTGEARVNLAVETVERLLNVVI